MSAVNGEPREGQQQQIKTDDTSMNSSSSAITTMAARTNAVSEMEIGALTNATPLINTDEKLSYSIHRYSSFSTNYFPENILVDCPGDQSSRWSAHTNSPPQYLTLKLKRPSVVKKIKFGKFEKSHVCNIKKFRVYGGMNDDSMILLLEGGLKNDNIPEVFTLRHVTDNGKEFIPMLYLKIVPLLSWGATFNFSIWYIELLGQDDPMYTAKCLTRYNKLREAEIVRLCLKHFRQQGYMTAFKALQEQTKVQLEDSIVADLHKHLVVEGDFAKAEDFVVSCIEQGLMDGYLQEQDYKHKWQLQETHGASKPGNRGGHQLVIDTKKNLIYLYGGWDGFQDMSDLWAYDINTGNWSLICEKSEKVNGPTPRSCHKMVFDAVSENIFMLGRYLDNSIRTTEYIKSDFYLFDTRAKTWLQICDDTSQVGGPQLVYDHQMCIDVDKRIIYVFGGKVLTPRSVSCSSSSSEMEYSGLYTYHIDTNTWHQILVDCHHPNAAQADVLSIKSRITHCMVFHCKQRKLYIYGGQRGKEDIDEFISYDVDSQVMSVLNKGLSQGESTPGSEPSPGYTLRATIDCERNEIYVFSSLNKVKDRRDVAQTDACNSFWVYSLTKGKWSRIYLYRRYNGESPNSVTSSKTPNDGEPEPCPRYAHQLVYDEKGKKHYLFGGNPGKLQLPQLRLDDFWILDLEKPKREEILRQCRFLLRELRYEEMIHSDPFKAMEYLRTDIAEVIDHSNPDQLSKFHKLPALLFQPDDNYTLNEILSTVTPSLGNSCGMLPAAAGDAGVGPEQTLLTTGGDEDKTDSSDAGQSVEDASIESFESALSSEASSSHMAYRPKAGKRPRKEYACDMNTRRAFLFNKLVKLLPAHMVQPEKNLSDFVTL